MTAITLWSGLVQTINFLMCRGCIHGCLCHIGWLCVANTRPGRGGRCHHRYLCAPMWRAARSKHAVSTQNESILL